MKNPPVFGGFLLHFKVERATGLEPATATLARWYSTIELRARWMGSRPKHLPSVKPLEEAAADGRGGGGQTRGLQAGCNLIGKDPANQGSVG